MSESHSSPAHPYPIVAVGILTQDIVLDCPAYPAEDSSIRATSQSTRPGGNATNTLCVLSLLSACPASKASLPISLSLLASLGTPASSTASLSTLHSQYHIDTSPSIFHQLFPLPTSYIFTSASTGSRTIVHHRGRVPELGPDAIERLKAVPSLVHWEGRSNVDAIAAHMANTRARCHPSLALPPFLSLEVEKPRQGIEALLPLPDVLFLSKEYARHLCPTADSPPSFFAEVGAATLPLRGHQAVVVPWGEKGAGMRLPTGQVIECEAMKVAVVDSVGAGDSFIGGWLYGVMRERVRRLGRGEVDWAWELEASERIIRFACGVAGERCRVKSIGDLQTPVLERHINAIWEV